tara:strand:+ start:449 stop:739 length:291 start_codon:yes stop_codon:yes gene_type:complete
MLLVLLILLNACAVAPSWLATGTGAYSEYKVISAAKTGIDLGLSMNDMPTTNDAILSKITGYECKVSRAIKEGIEYICANIKVHPPENGSIDKDKK